MKNIKTYKQFENYQDDWIEDDDYFLDQEEDFEEPETKIDIRTGSHFTNEAHNSEQYSLVNDLLLNEENPTFDIFNEEIVHLDSTDGFISIIFSSNIYDAEDFTYLDAIKTNNYLRDNFKRPEDNLTIYLTNWNFTDFVNEEKYIRDKNLGKYKI